MFTYCDIHYAETKESVYIGYWCKSTSVIEVISPLRNVIFKQKRSLNSEKKIKKIPTSCLQREDLKVLLKLSEKNVRYHFTRILVMTGSHLGRWFPIFFYLWLKLHSGWFPFIVRFCLVSNMFSIYYSLN